MDAMSYDLWGGDDSDCVLMESHEKILAETKCRHDTSHQPPDNIGLYEERETHLSEHKPFLNNVATAMRRTIAKKMMSDFKSHLGVMYWPEEAIDYDGANSQDWRDQEFFDEVVDFHSIRADLAADDLPFPRKDGTPRLPWDILEFVPLHPDINRQTRSARLRADLWDELARAEREAMRGDITLMGDRSHDTYWSNENFVDQTMECIFNFLAFDPGLSRVRMLELGKMFHSLLLEPWYLEYGRPGGRLPNENPQGVEWINSRFRDVILDMDNMASSGFTKQTHKDFRRSWWAKACYEEVLPFRMPNPTGHDIHQAALYRWKVFYKNWLQILVNVEETFVKATQAELDAAAATNCDICGDTYVIDSEYDSAYRLNCGNGHLLCKKCLNQLSLIPTRPYNREITAKSCPSCRGAITYTTALRNLTADMGFMPRLNTDFPYV
ncbi:hypothetical protein Daus18300_012229 [Diaporthe australafricana]|uniref:RING-type domain-containing protein n=1 Tax=Diaporthe australafricana TaxID=127596 RepID=A0ABR3W3J8_9PEZI